MITYSKFLKKNKHVIFLFHGVIPSNEYKIRNYNRKHIEKNYFENVINDLYKFGTPISIGTLVDINKNKKKLPEFSFSITFDDGFENNLSIASPILLKKKIPFTIYLTTNFIQKNEMSWIDKIEYAFEHSKEKFIKFPWRGGKKILGSLSQRISLLDEIRKFVKSSKSINSDEFSKSILKQLNIINIKKDKYLDRKLSWTQISEMASNNLITFGAHTHNHLILSYLDSNQLYTEIDTCIKLIKKKTGIKVKHFSYPEGFKNSFDRRTIDVLKKFKIQSSPTAIHGLNTNKTSLFNLKRISVI